ncbi:hypothetical protein PBY51_004308 [Eleginops maclovinus]|uniref:Uncharacterized protein n=1 Tax=Eleginops maclovinus TaxID=56733 RepID=A0AAN8AW93_ELEMC|nr:hypothetical protein PBY51_004308 [Eleginops maclovinus]
MCCYHNPNHNLAHHTSSLVHTIKGIQATVSSESVALGTTTQPFTSTPLKDSQPAKRPRLELKEEVEDVAIVGTDPQDATYDAAQSVPTETESSQLFASSAFSRGVLCAPVLVIFGLAEEGPS